MTEAAVSVPVRHLAPQFLEVVGNCVVAVDRVQPVAATLLITGEVLDVVSWAGKSSPPPVASWPNRRVGVDGDCLLVQDQPDGQPVAVSVRPDGSLAVAPASTERSVRWRYPRLLRAVPKSVGSWEFRFHRDGYLLRAEVVHDEVIWAAGRGSIIAHAVLGELALVAIRRADVRPWDFSPHHELVFLDGRTGAPVPTGIARIDISHLCWPTPQVDVTSLMREYLPYTLGQADILRERGGRDGQIHVAGLDADPVIELEFSLDEYPGKRLVRRDQPLDELGNLAGLDFWNIVFDDESLDLLAAGPADGQGRILV